MASASVLLVARSMPWQIQGGFEEHCWRLAKALTQEGASVTIVTTAFDETVERETREGIQVEYVTHLPRARDRKPMWRWWGRFPSAARKRVASLGRRFDLMLSEGRGGRKLLSADHVHGRRTAYVSHGTFDQAYRLFARSELLTRVPPWHPRAIAQALIARRDFRRDRLDVRSAKWVVAVSPFVAESLRSAYKVPADRIHIIGNGVSPPAKLSTKAGARKRLGLGSGAWLLFLGRLEPVKGLKDLVDAVRQRPDWNLLIAGTGPDEQGLKKTVADDAGLRDRVRFLGRVSDTDKWDCYAACDVFVLPSNSEGEPIAILEALASARPVVTTRDWIAPDLKAGCVVGTDLVHGIDDALTRTFPSDEIARRVAQAHSWKSVARQYLTLS